MGIKYEGIFFKIRRTSKYDGLFKSDGLVKFSGIFKTLGTFSDDGGS